MKNFFFIIIDLELDAIGPCVSTLWNSTNRYRLFLLFQKQNCINKSFVQTYVQFGDR